MVGADLSRDRPPHGSQHPFGSGQSLHPLSGPLQPGICFLRDPLPATDAPDFTTGLVAPRSATRLRAYPVPYDEHGSGGPHLSAGDRFVSVSPPSRETSDHVPFWSEPVSRFGSLRLDGIYQWFTSVGPLTQPCASSGFRLPESRDGPHGHHVPARVATLSVRSARGRCRPRTAPRLLAAERQVAYTLPRGQQLISRFAPRTQPTSALWAEAATETAAFFDAFRHHVLADVSSGLLFHT
jgi:hypothetical protein